MTSNDASSLPNGLVDRNDIDFYFPTFDDSIFRLVCSSYVNLTTYFDCLKVSSRMHLFMEDLLEVTRPEIVVSLRIPQIAARAAEAGLVPEQVIAAHVLSFLLSFEDSDTFRNYMVNLFGYQCPEVLAHMTFIDSSIVSFDFFQQISKSN